MPSCKMLEMLQYSKPRLLPSTEERSGGKERHLATQMLFIVRWCVFFFATHCHVRFSSSALKFIVTSNKTIQDQFRTEKNTNRRLSVVELSLFKAAPCFFRFNWPDVPCANNFRVDCVLAGS